MSAVHIAVISDDPASRRRLRSVLFLQNYLVCDAPSTEHGRRSPANLIILEDSCDAARIPEACCQLRSHSDVAVIALAHSASEAQRIAALDAGADDFLIHPFSNSELLARIRVILRRRNLPNRECPALDLAGVRIDLARRKVIAGDTEYHLTPKETGLLACLLQHPNATVPHSQLLRAVWGQPRRDHGACLRVIMNQLRRKIESDPGHPQYLVTERWVGYRFQLP